MIETILIWCGVVLCCAFLSTLLVYGWDWAEDCWRAFRSKRKRRHE